MTAYLAYLYSTCLTKKEKIEIDKKTKKSREKFSKSFVKFLLICLLYNKIVLISNYIYVQNMDNFKFLFILSGNKFKIDSEY